MTYCLVKVIIASCNKALSVIIMQLLLLLFILVAALTNIYTYGVSLICSNCSNAINNSDEPKVQNYMYTYM